MPPPVRPCRRSQCDQVAYRNKTFVSFASEDIRYYRMMEAWRDHDDIDFSFHDAHDLNTARDTSVPATIQRRLRERLRNSKQVVVLVGEQTRVVARRPHRFLYHEVAYIRELGLPVIFAQLSGARTVQSDRLPSALGRQYSVCVSFQMAIIKYALDDFVDTYPRQGQIRSGPHQYPPSVYRALGL